jgi:tellurite resistance protein TerC
MTMATSIWFWVAFNALVLILLTLDLGVFHRKAHVVSMREAGIWTAVWVALAIAFNGWVFYYAGSQAGLEFLTGYLVEKSLAVDNIFVFVMIFSFFAVPPIYQHRVLFWGILGALLMRGGFIAAGAYMLDRWHWIIYIFGALLVVTGIKMLLKRQQEPDLARNPVLKLTRKLMRVTDSYHGQRFTMKEAGQWYATPLLLVLILVEVSDLIFAIDSIPAIFAITRDPFIVYTSNVFAILGLRSMYFLLANIVHRFVYLKVGLSFVLVFIGIKMMIIDVYKVPTTVSLLVVGGLIGGSVMASLLRRQPGLSAEKAAQGGPAVAQMETLL